MSHAPLGYGGSVAAHTMDCPGWIALASTLPEDVAHRKGGPAADKGTLCHSAMDLLLRGKVLKAYSLEGMTFNQQVLTSDDIDDMILPAYAQYQEVMRRDHTQFYTELSAAMRMIPGVSIRPHGTADVVAIYDDLLVVLDWKFGRIPVVPWADQFHFYACCVLDSIMPDAPLDLPVELIVIQPLVYGDAQVYRTAVEGLNIWRARYELALREAEGPAPHRAPGDSCTYCPCKMVCDEYLGRVRSLTSEHPEILSPETLSELASGVDLAESFAETVKSELTSTLASGTLVPGWKQVAGRKRYSWRNELEAAKTLEHYLGAEVWKMNLLTPAQARDKLSRVMDKEAVEKVLEDLVVEGRCPPRSVPDSDPRTGLAGPQIASTLANTLSSILKRGNQ